MKTIKKAFAMLLAVVMVLGLSVTAFADDPTYSITVKNTPSSTNISIVGKTFSAYKIFDVSYADTDNTTGNDAFAYTISTKNGTADNPWFSAVLLYMGGGTNAATAGTGGVYTGGGLKLTPTANDPTKYVVETTVDSDNKTQFGDDQARALADFLTEWLNKQTTKPTADGTGTGAAVTPATDPATEQAVISNLPAAGYYLVTGEGTADKEKTVVAAAALKTTQPTAEIDLKAEAPTLDKEITNGNGDNNYGTSAEVGETVNFKLTSVVPDTTGYDSYTYLVSDTLSKGFTLNVAETEANTFTVKVGTGDSAQTVTLTKAESAEKVTGDTYYITNNADGTTTFKISLNMLKDDKTAKYTKGTAITIEYSATVNENALTTNVETNTATLTYSNNPYGTTTATTPEEKVYVYDFDIIVDKYTGDETTGARLAGAKFVLYKKDTSANMTYYQAVYSYTYTDNEDKTVTVYSADGTNYYSDADLKTIANVPEGTTPTKGAFEDVAWTSDITKATVVTTDENGAAKFQGLEEGTYYLRETEAPSGYNQLTEDVKVDITVEYDTDGQIKTGSGSTTTVSNTNENPQYSITSKVENNTGTELPSTGGIGTTIFYVVGSILVIGAAVLLITKKRMSGVEK